MSSYELCKLNKKLTVIMQLKTSNHFFNINFSYHFFCWNMKISKDLPAKYYQNKTGFKKKQKKKKRKKQWQVLRSFWRKQKQKEAVCLQTL